MFLKTFGIGAPILLGGFYFAGALDGGYSRDINQPLPTVMAALSDADIRSQPGSPGTDPSAAGGVRPFFRTENTKDSITWTVMSGDKVAVTMKAKLEPINDGKGTHVAESDYISPAFRSKSITMALFASMLESELNELTASKSREAGNGQSRPHGKLSDGIKNAIAIHAAYGEYERTGKDPFESGGFVDVKENMSEPEATPGVKFEPGKPMIDVSR
jgi:hypothetical protein